MKPFLYNMDYVNSQSEKKLFTVVSMFAGGGGSSTGYRLSGGNVLAINEFIDSAQETYHANYPNTYIFKEDIRKLSGEMILNKIGLKKGELDIFDGSPPCSSFSTIGAKEKMWGKVKKYSDSEQITDDLFFEFARILKELQPKVFVCENVKGITMGESSKLLGSSQFDLFNVQDNTILNSLINAGYNVRYKVLNAKNYNVPQSRERTIFIGVRKDIKKEITYPKSLTDIVSLGDALNDERCILINQKEFNENSPMKVLQNINCFRITNEKIDINKRYKIIRHGISAGYENRSNEDKIFVNSDINVSPTILASYKGLSSGLVELEYENGDRVLRKLSINELKILCSFPIDYNLLGSYAKQWERLGRAVPPLMMKNISEHIYNTILK